MCKCVIRGQTSEKDHAVLNVTFRCVNRQVKEISFVIYCGEASSVDFPSLDYEIGWHTHGIHTLMIPRVSGADVRT